MHIKKVWIDWMVGYGNFPQLKATVDLLPKRSEMRYRTQEHKRHSAPFFNELIDPRSFWAEQNGYVNFFYHDPKDQSGYGGQVFSGLLQFGGPFAVKGPWSSSSLNMNQHFPAAVECTFYEQDGDFPRLGIAGHLLIAEALPLIPAEAQATFVTEYGNNDEVDEQTRLDLIGRFTFDDFAIIGGYALVFKRSDCHTLAESQLKKNEKAV